ERLGVAVVRPRRLLVVGHGDQRDDAVGEPHLGDRPGGAALLHFGAGGRGHLVDGHCRTPLVRAAVGAATLYRSISRTSLASSTPMLVRICQVCARSKGPGRTSSSRLSSTPVPRGSAQPDSACITSDAL